MYSTVGINKPKRVDVYDEDGNYLSSFASLRACAHNLSLGVTTLHRAIQTGKRLGKYFYKYGTEK